MKKIVLFIVLFFIILIIYLKIEHVLIQKVYIPDSQQFYDEPKNSIDLIFFGSSFQHWGISPMELWNKYSIVSYKRSAPFEGGLVMLKYIEEALLYQKPKVIYIDAACILIDYLRENDWLILNNMKFSFNKILYIYELYKDDFFDKINILNMFHTRWKELRQQDFVQYSYAKGLTVDRWLFITYSQEQNIEYENKSNFVVSDKSIYILEQILELADKYNTKAVFVFPPMNNQLLVDKSIAFEETAKEKKLDYINMNRHLQEINIDFSKDFWNPSHINLYGGRKQMDYVIPYIIKKYNIPNCKNDIRYKSWNEDYKKYERIINKHSIVKLQTLSDWLPLSQYDNYTMLISIHGDNVLNMLSQDMKDKFKTLGLNKFETDKKNQKYVAIIDDGQVFYEEISDERAEYKGRMKNLVNLTVSSENKNAAINVSGKPKSKNKYGINFVIYDKVKREVVDSIWIEPKNFNQVRR